MPKKPKRILALDPGTRWMGVAVLDGEKLIYHGVEVVKKGNSISENLKNARKAVLRLIQDFQPDLLAIERCFLSRSRNASLLKVLNDDIRLLALRKKLRLVSYAPTTVRKAVCGNGWADKYEVAHVVAQKYPELKVYLTQDRVWKERFHHNMFDAVAVGMMGLKI